MPSLLLDANMPIGLRTLLLGHAVVTAYEAGWNTLTNRTLTAADSSAGFDMLLTGDQNLPYQTRPFLPATLADGAIDLPLPDHPGERRPHSGRGE